MKKFALILILAVILALSFGCGNASNALPKEYPSELAIENGDYVNVHGAIYNEDVLTAFLAKADRGEDATIRIVNYTVEGDPIIKEASYTKEGGFTVTIDNTRDHFGEPRIKTNTYQNLLMYQDEESGLEYILVTDFSELTKEMFEQGFEDGKEITIVAARPVAG